MGSRLAYNTRAFGALNGTVAPSELNNSELLFRIDESTYELEAIAKYSDGTTTPGAVNLT